MAHFHNDMLDVFVVYEINGWPSTIVSCPLGNCLYGQFMLLLSLIKWDQFTPFDPTNAWSHNSQVLLVLYEIPLE